MDKQQMNEIKTLAELDGWAQRHGLSIENDPDYSLRRLKIMADNISKTLPLSYDVCGAKFKQKSHLLRHERTMHENNDHIACPHCQKNFKRRDNLKKLNATCNSTQKTFHQTMNARKNKHDLEKGSYVLKMNNRRYQQERFLKRQMM